MPEYFCKTCNYKTDNKAKYNRHLETSKHIELSRQIDEPEPVNEIKELKEMVIELSKTITMLNTKIDYLTSKFPNEFPIPILTRSPESAPSPVAKPVVESAPSPVAKPVAEPVAKPVAESVAKFDPSQVAEPTPEPNTKSKEKTKRYMDIEEEKKYMKEASERLAKINVDDAFSFLESYTPRQRKPKDKIDENNMKFPFNIIDYYRYNLLSKYM